jgi:hypothetical protein
VVEKATRAAVQGKCDAQHNADSVRTPGNSSAFQAIRDIIFIDKVPGQDPGAHHR